MKMNQVQEGNKIQGKVYAVKDNEVIVVVEDYPTEGTIYLNELTTKDVSSAKDVLSEGDEIEAIVKKKDDEAGVLLLSRIDIERDQIFEDLQNKFQEDESFEATVKEHNKGGLIVRAFGLDMFMPAREVSQEFTDDLSQFKGQTFEVKLIEISKRKIVVSRRAVQKDKQKEAKKKQLEEVKEGMELKGTVSKLMPYGAFVKLNDYPEVEGLLHVSEMSHHRVNKPSDILKEGDTVDVKVIEAKGQKRGLSKKALEKTPWQAFAETHNVGDQVKGKVVKKMKFGILVEVAKDVAGIINKSDYSWDPRFNLAGNVNVGDEVDVKILSLDPEKGRMQLSKKHLEYNPWDDVSVKVGEIVSGEVKELRNNGALVEVQGVYGFLPIGEISEKRIEDASEVLKQEQVINAKVLKFDRKQWQMVLSIQEYEQQRQREEYQKHLQDDSSEEQSQTLGELFEEKFKNLKK